MSWQVIKESDENEIFVAFHVMPMVKIDGELFPSAAHDVSENCPCRPLRSINRNKLTVLTHHDPDHNGAMTDKEWEERKRGTVKQ